MTGVLYRYLSSDHERLNALLDRAGNSDAIDIEVYSEFRKGLLRHISLEEKIILPAIARWQGGRRAAIADRLRLDHSAIVSLLVPPPNRSIIRTLQSVFEVHNPLEEDEGGLYRLFEKLAGSETPKMLKKLQTAPDVLVLSHNEKPELVELAKQALARAGFEFKEE